MATEWFISGNPTRYDVISAFTELSRIDWKQSTNVAVGDVIYLYVSKGYQAVKYKCKVNKVDLPKPEIDDRKFNVTGEFDGTYGRYMELELDPDIHDGSYKLVRETVNAYANMSDLSNVDYKDLNLVYLMSVGTWKQKVPAKKKTITDSNLPQTEKDRLTAILEKIWFKAENYEYQNKEKGRPSIGMFGTGFFTFLGKTDDVSPRNFIQMCIDILSEANGIPYF